MLDFANEQLTAIRSLFSGFEFPGILPESGNLSSLSLYIAAALCITAISCVVAKAGTRNQRSSISEVEEAFRFELARANRRAQSAEAKINRLKNEIERERRRARRERV